jgi:hypothetical protein
MRRVRHPAPGWRRRERRRSAGARAAGFRFALALVLAPLTFEYVSAEYAAVQAVGGTTLGETGAMTNWASDVATKTVSTRGQGTVEASRVTLAVAGGPVVVQWSLSFRVYVHTTGAEHARSATLQVEAVASLERDGVEVARWMLGEDHAQGYPRPTSQARVTGTAGGLFVDRPAPGARTYVLKVWNKQPSRDGVVTVGTRTMICEERQSNSR